MRLIVDKINNKKLIQVAKKKLRVFLSAVKWLPNFL